MHCLLHKIILQENYKIHFYLDGISAKKIATPEQIRKVSESHKKNWRYQWDINEARKMVLRTHTTCVTIKHLAETKPDEARVFSLGRVFRNEKVVTSIL